MQTPRFGIVQTENEVSITVHAPYSVIRDTEISVDGDDFRFYSTPYYLRLKLPGEIEENDESSGSYDCEKGDFVLKFSKVNKGEHFENLDMITSLLAPSKKKNNTAPTIEVIGNPSAKSEDINENLNDTSDSNDADAGDNWYIHQQAPDENVSLLINAPKYGFANKMSGILTTFEPAWIKEIIDLPMPDKTSKSDRRSMRERHELESFNEQHYIADLIQKECIEPYLMYAPEWETLEQEAITFTDEEVDLLKELPNKEYLLSKEETQHLLFSLVDILYGSCYNTRTVYGDNTVESGWTINKLSSTLCWFETFDNMEEAILASVRRSLCYPLFRNWELAMKVLEDVKKVIDLGRKYIIKRFCEIHKLFNTSYEPRHMLNQLYIKDYLIWLQQIPDSLIETLKPAIANVNPNKEDVALELEDIDESAYTVQEEDLVIENAVHEMLDQINELQIEKKEDETSLDSDDSDSNTKSSDSSSNDSSDSSSNDSSESSSNDSSDSDSDTDSETSSSSSCSNDE
ncbi:protein SHQ1 homolog isoform X2 [Prorops nasuta]|uniref:protein SHQ1 homolog isoform X2 n=1 Tax=Prorops nasuta TaxID=863751 RepID=UPI0034CD2C75